MSSSVCCWQILLLVFHFWCSITTSFGQPPPPSVPGILITFKDSLKNTSRLSNWKKENVPLCRGNTPNWTGLVCLKGELVGIRLEGMGLAGIIDVQTLTPLSSSRAAIIIAAVAGVLLIAIILATIVRRRRRNTGKLPPKTHLRDDANLPIQKAAAAADHSASEIYARGGGGEKGKLRFVRTDREKFELEDLLRAPAEVLGSGSFGSSYKAVLITGSVVVRRFRQMSNVGRDEFYGHMTRLGRLSHPNLLPLLAFYYRKEEKLLISDFVEKGSLASILHSNKSSGQPCLDWPARLKIIKGVAKGLSYLYENLSTLTLPHGNLKSSNVLLDGTLTPLLADYALAPVTNKDHAQQFMVAYKSPESTQHDRVTRKTDVWSLGILILEILTGKFPANYLKQGKDANADLVAWVNSVVREEWTGEVFDKNMAGKSGEGQMLKLLKIGLCCCEWEIGRRWDIREAMERIEELKEKDFEEDDYSFGSDGDICVSAMATDDDFSFSKTA